MTFFCVDTHRAGRVQRYAFRALSAVFLLCCGVFMTFFSVASARAATPQTSAKSPLASVSPVSNPAVSLETPTLGKDAVLTKLANGLTVLVMEDSRFPLVSTRLYVHAGSAYETPADAGISHVLEHMVFKGTDKRPKGAISRDVEAAGGYLNAATSFDYTVYINDLPDRQWKLGMDVARDMAFHPSLDPQELESEKNVVIAELKRGLDSPGSRLFNAVQAGALKGTPYERPIIGFEQTINAITTESMRAYIKKYYQPQNMLLVVVGNVQAAEVLDEAERTFAPYANDAAFSLPRPLDALTLMPGQPQITVQPGPWNKVYLAMALPVPGSVDYQSTTLDVLAHLLGGDATSYLYKKYKYDRQLVDTISVSNASFERVGLFFITAELSADKVETFWNELTTDLAQLQANRFSVAELDRAKLNLEDDLYRAKQTLPGLASKVGHFQFLGGGEQGEINYIEAIRSVDPAMLQQAIDAWLTPARLTTVVSPPQDTKAEALQATLTATLQKNWLAAKTESVAQRATGKTPEVIDLGKGRTVVLVPDDTLPYISMDMAFSGGDALLTPNEQGLASLVARVLTKGTTERNAQAIQTYLADRAAGMSASAGRKNVAMRLEGPARFNKDLLALFSDVLVNPAFDESEVQREIMSQTAAIKRTEDQPLGLAFRELPPFLFPDSVYGYKQLGSIDYLKTVKSGDVRAFWNKQKQRPWVLAVSGDFDREAILAFAKTLPVPAQPKVNVAEPTWGSKKTLDMLMPDRKQAHLMLIFKTAPDSSADTPGLDVMEAVLGGMGGPLFTRLRDEQGLGYTVTVFNQQTSETGYMVFYIGTEPDKVDQAEAGFRQIIAETAKNLLPVSELQRGINQIEGDYYREHQSLASRSSEAAALVLNGRPLDYNKAQIEKTRKVTPEILKELAKKYLQPDAAYVVKVLP